jgi:hypothetical protein
VGIEVVLDRDARYRAAAEVLPAGECRKLAAAEAILKAVFFASIPPVDDTSRYPLPRLRRAVVDLASRDIRDEVSRIVCDCPDCRG